MISAFLFIFIFLFLILSISRNYCGFLIFIFALSFLFKVLLGYIHTFVRPLGAASDEIRFENQGYLWSQDGIINAISSFDPSASYVFSSCIAFIYSIFGREVFLIQIVGAFWGAISIYYFYRLLVNLGCSARTTQVATVIMAFWPSLSLISVLVLRDIYIITALVMAIFYFHRFFKSSDLKDFFKFNFALLVGALFHGILFLFIPILIFFAWLNGKRKARITRKEFILRKSFFAISCLIPIFLIGMVFALQLGFGSSKVSQAESLLSGDIRAIQRFSGELIKSDDVILIYPAPSSFTLQGLALHLPERLSYFMFMPTINMFGKVTDVHRIIDSLLIYISLILILINSKKINQVEGASRIIVLLFIFSFVFALGSFDVATGVRHRLKVILPFVAISLALFSFCRRSSRTNYLESNSQ